MHSSQVTSNPSLSSIPDKASTNLKNETGKLPLPQASHGGNLPPVPPKIVSLAALPEDPDGDPRKNQNITPKYAVRILHPALPPALVPIPHAKKNTASPTIEPSFLDRVTAPFLKPSNSWLTVGAIGASTFALSSYLFNSNLVHSSSNLTYLGYALFTAGATATIGLTARLLGLFSGSKTQ